MALVTSGGAKVDTQGFYAYGRLRQGIIGVERGFTGQQKDFGTGLIYFNARYYDPELGTFISPDTVVPDAGNLFDYNRYMFVRGNPLKYNDPTGHDPCGPGANPHCTEYLQGLTTSGCQGNCGVSYDQFLTAKQQYADYKADPEQYAVDQQTLNGDVVGDVEAAKTRLSYGLLYASYFAHKNPDVDITMQASVDVLLASMSIISGNAKDVYRGGPNLMPMFKDVKIDPETGLLKTTHGVSVHSLASSVERFGGAYRVDSIPEGLRIIQRGKDPNHYEIVPANPMTFDQYSKLLEQVVLVGQ